jgi:hypothetical protein
MKEANSDELYDNGGGTMTVWKIEGFEKEIYPKEMHGRFFSSDSYIVLYSFQKKSKNYNLIYFWQGRDSSINEKGASALLSVNLSEITSGETLQIRCVQQQESDHFLTIFQPCVVHYGKYKSYKTVETEVFDVRESNTGLVRTIGISPKNITLHSNGCLVFKSKEKIFIRIGKNASPKETTRAKEVASALSSETPTEIKEGKEDDLLLSTFGKENFNSYSAPLKKSLRLFQLNGQSGVVEFDEIYDFSQYSLNQKDCFILDAGENIYCWYGNFSNFYTRKFSLELASEYLKKMKSKKLFVVKCFGEPVEFTNHFQSWEKWSWKNNGGTSVEVKLLESEYFLKEYGRKTYSYNELLEEKLPEGIDPTKLEVIFIF